MKWNFAVRCVMANFGVTVTRLSNRMGRPTRFLCDRLARDNTSIDKLNEILRLLDYKIVIVPRETRLRDGWYELE